MSRRAVVTGLGVISPLGNDIETLWGNLINGVSGVDKITRFDTSKYETQIGAEVKGFNPENYGITAKEIRRLDLFSQYALAAAHQAINNSSLKLEEKNHDIGAIIGSGVGGLGTTETQHDVLMQKGPGKVSTFLVPMMMINAASAHITLKYNLNGPSENISSACASGNNAIIEAYRTISDNDADVMITGGAEAAITKLAYAGFCQPKAMSKRNHDPKKASRPFDEKRDGFVMGEGSAILVLESLDHALARNAKIYAEIIGYCNNSDAHDIVAPHETGEEAALAMQRAINKSKIKPEEVDYINAHGTSTRLNDRIETIAIKRAFGNYAYKIPISSTKSMTGHLLGAAGGIEAIISILTIQRGIIPPTINYEFPDPECDLDYVPNIARKKEVKIAMSNAFGFGGHNAVVVFRKYDG
ncbi:beta-ketoacyl-ACP synthase II [Candidatus Woesearchaeota archaeon]|nr:beta-ketoacyl-ACP synthase II [Candidatus Woesearchaeota archaeon]